MSKRKFPFAEDLLIAIKRFSFSPAKSNTWFTELYVNLELRVKKGYPGINPRDEIRARTHRRRSTRRGGREKKESAARKLGRPYLKNDRYEMLSRGMLFPRK